MNAFFDFKTFDKTPSLILAKKSFSVIVSLYQVWVGLSFIFKVRSTNDKGNDRR